MHQAPIYQRMALSLVSFFLYQKCSLGLFRTPRLQNDKILDWSKLKAFAGDKINILEKWEFVSRRVENIAEQGENAGTSIFSFFHTVFKRLLVPWLLKLRIV